MFDCDGTLVDSRRDIILGVNHTLRQLGLQERTDTQISKHIGGGVRNMITNILAGCSQDRCRRAIDIFTDYFRMYGDEHTVLYPGVKEVLAFFRNKLLVVVTNRSRELAEKTLGAVGIRSFFDAVVGEGRIVCMDPYTCRFRRNKTCLKPSACPLRQPLRLFKIKPRQAVMVGDMPVDIQAGKRAGVITCGVTYGFAHERELKLSGPDFLISDIRYLVDMFL